MLTKVLLGLIVDAPHGEARRRIWRVGIVAALSLLGVAILGAALWLLVQTMVYGWQTVDWSRMQAAKNLPLYSLYVLLFPLVYLNARRPVPRGVQRALLDTLEANDTAIVQLAEPQPASLAEGDTVAALGDEPYDLVSLRAVDGGYHGASGYNPFLFLSGLLIMQLGSVLDELTQALGVDQTWHVFGFYSLALIFLFFFFGLACLFLGIMLLDGGPFVRRLWISVDQQGLVWQCGRWALSRRVEWLGVRAFWRAPHLPLKAAATSVTYVVDTESGTFGWTLAARSNDNEREASALLTRLIVTRSGVALRDLAPLMDDLARTKNTLRQLRRAQLPEAIKTPLMTVRQYGRRGMWFLLPALLEFALLVAVPEIAYNQVQATQHRYFTGLATCIVTQAPLFSDALTRGDGQWPVAKPSAADGQQRFAYANGAYTLSGQAGHIVLAYSPAGFDNAAVAVTARQQGSVSQDGVGLFLHADAEENNMLVFYVSPTDGTWSFVHFLHSSSNPDDSWQALDDGHSSAIHRGSGATNQLLVLARGPVYLLYVNGMLMDSYADTFHDVQNMPARGYAGVYLNDGATTGSYSDFTVYPVQSPPSLSYV